MDVDDIYVALSRVVYNEKGEGFLEEIQLPEVRDSLVAVLTPLLGAPEINGPSIDNYSETYVWYTQKGSIGFEYSMEDNKKYWNAIFSTSAIDTTGGYFFSLAFDVPQMYIKAAMIVADYKLTTTILDPDFGRLPKKGYNEKGGNIKEDWATYDWWMSAKGTPLDSRLLINVTERVVEGEKEEQIIRFIYGNL